MPVWAVINAVLNFLVLYISQSFLTSWKTSQGRLSPIALVSASHPVSRFALSVVRLPVFCFSTKHCAQLEIIYERYETNVSTRPCEAHRCGITLNTIPYKTYSRYSDWLPPGRPRGRSSSPGRAKNFLFSTSSRPVLRPTQPPIQWVMRDVSPGITRPWPLMSNYGRSKKFMDLYIHSTIRFHGVVLNYLSTETNLHLLGKIRTCITIDLVCLE
jgi:hypothetical protein